MTAQLRTHRCLEAGRSASKLAHADASGFDNRKMASPVISRQNQISKAPPDLIWSGHRDAK
jgi:hypothetical protein